MDLSKIRVFVRKGVEIQSEGEVGLECDIGIRVIPTGKIRLILLHGL